MKQTKKAMGTLPIREERGHGNSSIVEKKGVSLGAPEVVSTDNLARLISADARDETKRNDKRVIDIYAAEAS